MPFSTSAIRSRYEAKLSGHLDIAAFGSFLVASDKPPTSTKPAEQGNWISLFYGKTPVSGRPRISAARVPHEDGKLMLTHGESLTGVTWQGEPHLRMNYEIELDAQRVDGSDFFCGLTFPVNKSCASLIIGGWGGALCGISNIDDNDAANETTRIREFTNGK